MTPVDMAHLDMGTPGAEVGDCFRCCVATLLDLPRDDVPHFAGGPDGAAAWVVRTQEWLAQRGLLYIQVTDFVWPWVRGLSAPLVIAGGKSPRGVKGGHAVVVEVTCNGWRLIHDPHPSRAGIVGEPEDYGLFVRLAELRQATKAAAPNVVSWHTVGEHHARNTAIAHAAVTAGLTKDAFILLLLDRVAELEAAAVERARLQASRPFLIVTEPPRRQ